MESLDALLLMRMAERLLGLLAGGLCVVLGYRLFVKLPEKTNSSGKVVLPGGVSIWLSRVGPGISSRCSAPPSSPTPSPAPSR